MLGTVEGEEVLDLFAGTGALGIEALSRGAKRAVFVERDAEALKALAGNLQVLGLEAGEAEVRRGEALGALRSARACAETYDLILIDPPYRRASDLGRELSVALASLLGAKGARGRRERSASAARAAMGDRQRTALWRYIDHNPPSPMTNNQPPPTPR